MSRWWVWVPLLAVTLSFYLFENEAASPQVEVVQPLKRSETAGSLPRPSSRGGPSEGNAGSTPVLLARRTLYPEGRARPAANDLFAQRDWTPQAPASSGQGRENEGEAPFPYVYVGRKMEGDVTVVYLMRDDVVHLAIQGQMLDDSYRVDSITSSELVVTHVGTHRSNTMKIGSVE